MDHESAGVRAGETDGGSDDAIIDLYLTDAACAAGAGLAAAGGVAALSRVGAADGLPFLLGADGFYDLQLNRFFRELDSWGVRAANSVLAYARDIMLFCRFLAQSRGGKSIWKASPFPDCGNCILLSRYLRFQELIADLLRRPVPVR